MRTPFSILPALIIVPALFTACTSERGITVQHPAEVTMPATAARVVLMDRTLPRAGFSNAFESWTSRESGMDEGIGKEMNLVLEQEIGRAHV